jgi:hypothetical protein
MKVTSEAVTGSADYARCGPAAAGGPPGAGDGSAGREGSARAGPPLAATLTAARSAPLRRPRRLRSAPWRVFAAAPSLLWFHGAAGVSVDAALAALSAAGLALALAVLWGVGRGPMAPGGAALPGALGALWLLLLSARSVGQDFLAGPWCVRASERVVPGRERRAAHRGSAATARPLCAGRSRPAAARRPREALLLEAGWAAIWLAAHKSGATAPPALLLLRWQLFKACVLDATAKLRIACAGAEALGACAARLAGAAAAPGAAGAALSAAAPAGLALALAAQLPGSFLLLSPFRGARLTGAGLQVAAAAAGALTGAGAGAPALVLAALCLALTDDAALQAMCTRWALPGASGAAAPAAVAASTPAAKAAGGKPPGLTPIATGRGHARRNSFDELLASPRYYGGRLGGGGALRGSCPLC